jgi:hypothetical protein
LEENLELLASLLDVAANSVRKGGEPHLAESNAMQIEFVAKQLRVISDLNKVNVEDSLRNS